MGLASASSVSKFTLMPQGPWVCGRFDVEGWVMKGSFDQDMMERCFGWVMDWERRSTLDLVCCILVFFVR